MFFTSTRNPALQISFEEALFQGLSKEGGLFLPEEIKPINKQFFSSLDKNSTFLDIATLLSENLLAPELDSSSAKRICEKAFTFSPKITQVEDRISILELYHGPSCAFKDFGASFLASCMEFFLEKKKRRSIILTATSGDTGSAVAQAFHKKKSIEVVILYPSGRVSPLQEKQLTSLGDNITALEIDGSFDDCQRMVKKVFLNNTYKKSLPLTSANSINIGRLLPQSFYYFWAGLVSSKDEPLVFSVPCGNFGNLTAGILAKLWGLPVDRFIAATNANDVVPEYLRTGEYLSRKSIATLSNAMDVGAPSNFERLLSLLPNIDTMRKILLPQVISDADTLATINRIYRNQGLFIDPHTAVGVLAAEKSISSFGGKTNFLCLSTAHPGKFLEIVKEATGTVPNLPPQLKELEHREKKSIPLGNREEDLGDFLLKTFS